MAGGDLPTPTYKWSDSAMAKSLWEKYRYKVAIVDGVECIPAISHYAKGIPKVRRRAASTDTRRTRLTRAHATPKPSRIAGVCQGGDFLRPLRGPRARRRLEGSYARDTACILRLALGSDLNRVFPTPPSRMQRQQMYHWNERRKVRHYAM